MYQLSKKERDEVIRLIKALEGKEDVACRDLGFRNTCHDCPVSAEDKLDVDCFKYKERNQEKRELLMDLIDYNDQFEFEF
jgi:hypothetical protein